MIVNPYFYLFSSYFRYSYFRCGDHVDIFGSMHIVFLIFYGPMFLHKWHGYYNICRIKGYI